MANSTSRPVPGPDHPRVKFLALALLVFVSVGCGFLGGFLAQGKSGGKTTVEQQQVVLKTQGELISTIAKDVGESVVSVNTTANVVNQSFFGFNVPSQEQGAGTGIILTDDGLIVTNRHVVPAGTTKVSITLSDGTEFNDVKVIGRTNAQDSLDIAFLKINDTKGKQLKPARLGDSTKAQVGESVIAIGNALGQFQNTVTSGILSGYGRSIQAGNGGDTENLQNLIQTDAAINAGNSGGPLVNLEGEVIGINTAVASGDAQNIGFAIPISDVTGLIDSVKSTGKLERPYIGVVYLSLTNDLSEQLGLKLQRGAYVAPPAIIGTDAIVNDGPADKAGVQIGDIITKVDNDPIDERTSLTSLVNRHKVGDKVTLTVYREGKEVKLDATLAAAPTE